MRHAFITAQVALSILLVVVAGLFVRALERAGSIDPGFEPGGVELASIDLSQAGYTDVTGPQFIRGVVNRVRALPGVRAASAALVLPGGFETRRQAVTVPGLTPPEAATRSTASTGMRSRPATSRRCAFRWPPEETSRMPTAPPRSRWRLSAKASGASILAGTAGGRTAPAAGHVRPARTNWHRANTACHRCRSRRQGKQPR